MKHFAVILAFVAAAAQASVTNTVSNEASVKHWYRDTLTYDAAADTFSTNALSGVAESAALVTVAEAIPTLIEEATTALTNSLAPMQARLELEAQRPVVMLTGAAGLDNALDRENLTMAIVSNEWTVATNGNRHLDAYVFSNKILASPPVMQAALMTDLGTQTNWVDGVWDGYGSKVCTVELTHQNAYTNFVIVSRDYGETKVVDTNVTFTSIYETYKDTVVTNRYNKNSYITSGLVQQADITHPSVIMSFANYDFKAAGKVFENPSTVEVSATCPPYTSSNDTTAYWLNFANNHIYECLIAYGVVTVGGVTYMNNYYDWSFCGSGSGGFHVDSSGKAATACYHWLTVDGIARNRTRTTDGLGHVSFYTNAVTQANLTQNTNVFSTSRVYNTRVTNFMNGRAAINSLRVYNRVLTAAEIAHNAAVDYERFTLGLDGIQTNRTYYTVTNTYTQTISITNAVLITVDGQQPYVVKSGDKERFECYKLGFDLPPADQVRLNPWVKVGHPQNGFDFGNRQLRINGALAVTTNDVSEIGDWYTTDGNRVTLTPYLDQGLLRFADITDDSTED